MVKPQWKAKGYVDEPVPAGIDLKTEIRRLAQEKNAVILAHYYTDKPLQEVADSRWPRVARPTSLPTSAKPAPATPSSPTSTPRPPSRPSPT